MRLKLTSLAIALVVWFGSEAGAHAPKTSQEPATAVFRVEVWGYVASDFTRRVWDYVELRRELQKGLPSPTVTDDPAEIRKAVRALAAGVRVARRKAKQGDIFTPAISVEFRKALIPEMTASTWATLMDDNPGEFSNRINGTYPEGKSLSTVPASILAVLPRLPEDIQYRFLGRHLILLDTRANVILDRIAYAIQCASCGGLTGKFSTTCARFVRDR